VHPLSPPLTCQCLQPSRALLRDPRLQAAGVFVLVFTHSAPIVASVPVLGLCLSLGGGCFIALGVLGLVATTKLTGLLYLVRVIPTRFCTGVSLCSFPTSVACE